MRHLLSLFAGLALAIGVAQASASADTIPLGSLAAGDTVVNNDGGASGPPNSHPAISDHFTFTLTSPLSMIGGSILNTPFTAGSTLQLSSGNYTILLNGTTALAIDGSGNFSYSGILGPGSYFLDVGGTTSGRFGGTYQLTLSAVAATPIPAALVLFLTALGGLGGISWRRRSV